MDMNEIETQARRALTYLEGDDVIMENVKAAREILRSLISDELKDRGHYEDSDCCAECGAGEGLHHYKTNQCPVGGVEAPVNRKQEWADRTFRPLKVWVEPEAQADEPKTKKGE